MYDFSEMNAEQLEARKAELLSELDNPETRDALSTDDLEGRMTEIQAIDAEIENRKQAAAEEARQAEEVARMKGEPIIETEVNIRMSSFGSFTRLDISRRLASPVCHEFSMAASRTRQS